MTLKGYMHTICAARALLVAVITASPLVITAGTQAAPWASIARANSACSSQTAEVGAITLNNSGIAFVPAFAARLPIDGVGFTRLATAVAKPVELHSLWLKESANPALGRTVRVLEDCVPLE